MQNNLLQKIANSLNPTTEIIYWLNPKTNQLLSNVLYVQQNPTGFYKATLDFEEFKECMEDFCLQVADEQIFKLLKQKIESFNPIKSFEDFFIEKKHLKKKWDSFKNEWLLQKAEEFIKDLSE